MKEDLVATKTWIYHGKPSTVQQSEGNAGVGVVAERKGKQRKRHVRMKKRVARVCEPATSALIAEPHPSRQIDFSARLLSISRLASRPRHEDDGDVTGQSTKEPSPRKSATSQPEGSWRRWLVLENWGKLLKMWIEREERNYDGESRWERFFLKGLRGCF